MMRRWISLVVLLLMLTGCSGGAVVFAPTPAPPDLSPLLYTHPGGAFTLAVPRNWSVYEQNTTVLASASFSVPGSDEPALRAAVINLGQALDSAGLGEAINRYQTQIRPDVLDYTEVNRQAMGDGSWRLTGSRRQAGGTTRAVNTFIEQSGTLVGLIEVTVPDDSAAQTQLEQVINTFTLNPAAVLDVTQLNTLASLSDSSLQLLHVTAWRTPRGVFFITGEVANTGTALVTDVPVRAVLRTGEGLAVAEAVDQVMGYGIPPGGFAPFSLRFGQGQPALTTDYEVSLGGIDWVSDEARLIYNADSFEWDDSGSLQADGSLVISGSARNIGESLAREVRAIATVFDGAGNVVAAGFTEVSAALQPGARAEFRLVVPEMGSQPGDEINYILMVQGLP